MEKWNHNEMVTLDNTPEENHLDKTHISMINLISLTHKDLSNSTCRVIEKYEVWCHYCVWSSPVYSSAARWARCGIGRAYPVHYSNSGILVEHVDLLPRNFLNLQHQAYMHHCTHHLLTHFAQVRDICGSMETHSCVRHISFIWLMNMRTELQSSGDWPSLVWKPVWSLGVYPPSSQANAASI